MLTSPQRVVLDMLGLPGAEGRLDLAGRIAVYVPFVANGKSYVDRRALSPATFASLVRGGHVYHCSEMRTFALPGAWIRNLHELALHVRDVHAPKRSDRIAMLATKLGATVEPIRFDTRVVGLVLAGVIKLSFPIREAAWNAAVKRAQVLAAATDTSPRT